MVIKLENKNKCSKTTLPSPFAIMTPRTCVLEVWLLHNDSLALRLLGMWLQLWSGCLHDVYTVCASTRESACSGANACPDYAGIIVGRWRKLSLKVRVLWLIRSSLYHFN